MGGGWDEDPYSNLDRDMPDPLPWYARRGPGEPSPEERARDLARAEEVSQRADRLGFEVDAESSAIFALASGFAEAVEVEAWSYSDPRASKLRESSKAAFAALARQVHGADVDPFACPRKTFRATYQEIKRIGVTIGETDRSVILAVIRGQVSRFSEKAAAKVGSFGTMNLG